MAASGISIKLEYRKILQDYGKSNKNIFPKSCKNPSSYILRTTLLDLNELIEDKITLKRNIPTISIDFFFEKLLVEMELWTIFVGLFIDL